MPVEERSMAERLKPSDALLVVDVQNDFCPGGALPVAEGDQVPGELNPWIAAAVQSTAGIYASRDWHPPNHCSFTAQGGPWPVHCVRETPGAAFHPALELPAEAVIISKGTDPSCEAYSAFQGGDLARMLQAAGIRRLWVGGLALDYCVKASILDALDQGFEVHVILPATRPVNLHPDDGRQALSQIQHAGATIEGNTL